MHVDDTRPIWAQLLEEFQRRIVTGQWPPGSRVPSVRELAQDLGVNPNTVQRALTGLDRSGLTATERTSGRFVTAGTEAVAQLRHEFAVGGARAYRDSSRAIGLELDEAVQLLTECWAATDDATTDRTHDHEDDSHEH